MRVAYSVHMKTNVLSVLWLNVIFLELSGVGVLFAKRLFWCTGLSDSHLPCNGAVWPCLHAFVKTQTL